MNRSNLLLKLVLLLAACCAGNRSLQAQDVFGDLFGAPAAAAPAATEFAAPATASDTEPAVETDPAVLGILESNPQTARELVRSVELMRSLDRPAHSKAFLAQLSAAALGPEVLAELQRQFGSTMFLGWMRDPALLPEGHAFANSVLDAAYQASRDPQRLAGLIQQLGAATPEVRRAAVLDLRQAGDAGLAALVGALGDDRSRANFSAVGEALVLLGNASAEPLIAGLQSDNDLLRAEAARVLGRLALSSAVPYLLAPALAEDTEASVREAARGALRQIVGGLPDRSQAQRFLERRVQSLLAERRDVVAEQAFSWQWDAAQQQVQREELPGELAALGRAAGLTSQLHQLEPDNPSYQQLFYTVHLEAAQRRAGLDENLDSQPGSLGYELAGGGDDKLSGVLAFALEEGHSAAALAVIRLMKDYGSAELVINSAGRMTELVTALRHPDRRIRFAAAEAIGKLSPRRAYPGSSYLPGTLAYFARSMGSYRGLIIHPRVEVSQSLVAMLADLGMETDTAQTVGAGYQRVREHADYELILVSDTIDQPPIKQFLQRLRQDPLTAHLPVGIMAQPSRQEDLERRTEFDTLTEVFPVPHSLELLAIFTDRLLESGARFRVPYPVRLRQANAALQQYLYFAENSERYPFYDLHRHQDALQEILFSSALAPRAAPILGELGSPGAQRALVTVASQNSRELATRQAAAAAFETAVQRRGLLLTRGEILQQYDRYNQSAQLDRATQQVLGSLLDSIERRTSGEQVASDFESEETSP